MNAKKGFLKLEDFKEGYFNFFSKSMQILHTKKQLQTWLEKNKSPAFVPTMGFLHEAHMQLIEKAKETKQPVLVSIFVNPKQFREGEDFFTYPRNEKKDIEMLKEKKVDAVFIPEIIEIYPENISIILPKLPKKFSILEGELRKGYFEGIATVLKILFELIQPHCVIFGQKDYQQNLLVHWLVKKNSYPFKIYTIPIFREPDGLAFSSRNAYLSTEERKEVPHIYQSLLYVKKLCIDGEKNVEILEKKLIKKLQKNKITSHIDICEILDAKSLEKIEVIEKNAVVLLYIKVGIPRLLDNIILEM